MSESLGMFFQADVDFFDYGALLHPNLPVLRGKTWAVRSSRSWRTKAGSGNGKAYGTNLRGHNLGHPR